MTSDPNDLNNLRKSALIRLINHEGMTPIEAVNYQRDSLINMGADAVCVITETRAYLKIAMDIIGGASVVVLSERTNDAN